MVFSVWGPDPPLFEKKNIFKQHFEDEGFPKHVIKGIVLVYLYYNIQQTQGLASNLKETDSANRFLYIYTRRPSRPGGAHLGYTEARQAARAFPRRLWDRNKRTNHRPRDNMHCLPMMS